MKYRATRQVVKDCSVCGGSGWRVTEREVLALPRNASVRVQILAALVNATDNG
jgi:hypothetical protein